MNRFAVRKLDVSDTMTYHLGREDKYPYYLIHQNPNRAYELLQKENFFAPYQELLTDGVVRDIDQTILIENSSFVIVREMRLGKYQFANLYTLKTDIVSLAYYGYLTSTSYAKMKKLENSKNQKIYQLKKR